MSAEATATPGDEGLEPIRRVKTLETENAGKLEEIRARLRSEIDGITREAEGAVAASRSAGEGARDRAIAEARSTADREAEAILAEGRTKAAAIRGRTPAELAALKEPVLSAVLGEFRGKGKRPEA